MLLAPGSVLKFLGASGSGAATLKWGRSPHGDVRTNLKAVFLKDGGDLVVIGDGTLKFSGPKGRTLSFYNGGWGYGASLALFRHNVKFKFTWFVCYGYV